MNKTYWPKGKVFILFSIVFVYFLVAGVLSYAVSQGMIQKSHSLLIEEAGIDSTMEMVEDSPMFRLQSAQEFMENSLVEDNGHVNLYISPPGPNNNPDLEDNDTNSEAISYYMLWTAKEHDKKNFDKALAFYNEKMAHPRFGYMMWRLNADDLPEGDGVNIATDADLRAIKALLIAEKQWGDKEYTTAINKLATGLEKVGITSDGYLAPYGGVSGETSTWTAREVWLSYEDFTVLKELSERRGRVWVGVYDKMKRATLNSQIANGLYNSMLTEDRNYGNGLDSGGYSINSMWMMVRNAESDDPQLKASANKSLQFYKNKYAIDAEIYAQYSSSGDALSSADTPWAYALVGRAAIALNDEEFSKAMIKKLLAYQSMNNQSGVYGAFPEGSGKNTRIGQFTMQESILTLQDFNEKINWI